MRSTAGIDEVRARIDVAGHELRRLLAEREDTRPLVGFHETEGTRIIDVVQRDRDGGGSLPVERGHLRQIEVGQDVTVEREERRVPQRGERVHDRATGPEGLVLHDPRDGGIAVTRLDEGVERRLQVGGRQDHLVHTVAGEVVEHVVQPGPVNEREQWLRGGLGEGTHPRSLAADQDDGLHRFPFTRAASAPRTRSRSR